MDQVKWRTVAIALGAVAVLGVGGVWAVNTSGVLAGPAPAATPVAEVAVVGEVPAGYADAPIHPVAAPPVVEPVEQVPSEEAPTEDSPAPGQPGEAVPFVTSADPNNANGGDYIDPGMYCLSGSASGAPPVCD